MKTLRFEMVVLGGLLLCAACGGGAGSGEPKTEADAKEGKGYGYEFENEKVSPAMTSAAETKGPTTPTPGKLAPEEIQKVVRADFGKLKACYEEALKADAKLTGKLAATFVIKVDGTTEKVAKTDGTTLTDEKMVQCSLDVFKALKFPMPEGGIVTVVYPIDFSP